MIYPVCENRTGTTVKGRWNYLNNSFSRGSRYTTYKNGKMYQTITFVYNKFTMKRYNT